MSDIATDCDACHQGIPHHVTCYAIPAGIWEGDDADHGKPVVKILCADCYARTGRTTNHQITVKVISEEELHHLTGRD